MYNYCKLSRRQRVNLRNRVERLSELLGWSSLTVYYQIARQLALRKAYRAPKGHKTQKAGVAYPVAVNAVKGRSDRFDPERNSLSSDQVPPEQLEM